MSWLPPPMWRSRPSRNSVPSSIGRLRARLRRASSTGSSVVASNVRIDSCVLFAISPVCSASNSMRPRDARSRLAVVSARRVDWPSRMTAPAAGVRPTGGAGMWIDGSSRYTGSRPCRYQASSAAPTISTNPSGATSRPSTALRRRKKREARGVLGRRGVVDLLHRHQQRPVEVAPLEQRQHLVLVDRLAVRVRQELGPVARAGVQLDLAVAGVVGLEVEQDHEAVVEALAADAPLVHQLLGVGLGRRGVLGARRLLRVDDDLGAGPLLDRVDHRLDLGHRGAAEHARRVVDGLVVDGIRERRAGRDRGPGGAKGEREDGDDREGEPDRRGATGGTTVDAVTAHGRTIREARRQEATAVATGWRARIRRTSSAACS